MVFSRDHDLRVDDIDEMIPRLAGEREAGCPAKKGRGERLRIRGADDRCTLSAFLLVNHHE